jgi:hypothetical protein
MPKYCWEKAHTKPELEPFSFWSDESSVIVDSSEDVGPPEEDPRGWDPGDDDGINCEEGYYP